MRTGTDSRTAVRLARQVIQVDVNPSARVGYAGPGNPGNAQPQEIRDANTHFFTVGVDDFNTSSNGKWILG